MDIQQLLEEVFFAECRRSAELRLLPGDAAALEEQVHAQCRVMDETVYADGKRWYLVTLPADAANIN